MVVARLIKKYLFLDNELHPEGVSYYQRAIAEESSLRKCYSASVLDKFRRNLVIFCTRKAK